MEKFLKILKEDLAIPLQGIYSKAMQTGSWRDICTHTVALFTIAKIWKKWMNGFRRYDMHIPWYIIKPWGKKMQFCHSNYMDEPWVHMLSKISQTWKDKYCMVSFIHGILRIKVKLIETKNRKLVPRSQGVGVGK